MLNSFCLWEGTALHSCIDQCDFLRLSRNAAVVMASAGKRNSRGQRTSMSRRAREIDHRIVFKIRDKERTGQVVM